MGVPGQKGKRIRDNGLFPPESYKRGHFYIVDDIDPDAEPRRIMGREKIDPHTEKCNLMRQLFSEYTDYEIHSVRFPRGSKAKDVEAYWKNEFATKEKDELLIIYFHGKAGGEDDEYKWTLSQYPRVQLNAYRLIEKATESACDSLFLLDCYLQTRLTDKWSRLAGSTEIITRPESMAYADGKVMEHNKDFTEAIVVNLSEYTELVKLKGNRDKSMKTIPQILAKDKEMYSNLARTWLDKPKNGDTKVIKRIKLDPNLVRRDGKIEFFKVQIQGNKGDGALEQVEADAVRLAAQKAAEERNSDRENSLFDDETFGDDDGMDEAAAAAAAAEAAVIDITSGDTSTSGGSSVSGNDSVNGDTPVTIDGSVTSGGPGCGNGPSDEDSLFMP